MAKSKRNRTAKNKIAASLDGALIKADSNPLTDPPAAVDRSHVVTIVRSRLFTAEFEAVIEIIARDRVYRAMLDRLGRRLITGPFPTPNEPPIIPD